MELEKIIDKQVWKARFIEVEFHNYAGCYYIRVYREKLIKVDKSGYVQGNELLFQGETYNKEFALKVFEKIKELLQSLEFKPKIPKDINVRFEKKEETEQSSTANPYLTERVITETVFSENREITNYVVEEERILRWEADGIEYERIEKYSVLSNAKRKEVLEKIMILVKDLEKPYSMTIETENKIYRLLPWINAKIFEKEVEK